MYQSKTVTAVILAAGSGTRMGLNINKVYIKTGNGAIVQYSIRAFAKNPYVDHLVLVIRPEDELVLNEIVMEEALTKPVQIVHGGATRADSVYNGITCIDSDISIVHDGARPLVKQEYISACIEHMSEYPGAIVGIKAQDMIAKKESEDRLNRITGQDHIYLAQTPQCFHTKILKDCHEALHDKSMITDDSSLLEMVGYPVKMLPGDKSNIKITTPQDLKTAIAYLDIWDLQRIEWQEQERNLY